MARPKGLSKIKKHVFKDPQIEDVVEVEVEFVCPKRGKIKQKVKMKKLRSVKIDTIHHVDAKLGLEDLDKEDDGLSMYGDAEG